jgi:hypothetical protein
MMSQVNLNEVRRRALDCQRAGENKPTAPERQVVVDRGTVRLGDDPEVANRPVSHVHSGVWGVGSA